jgi:DNA-binding transcriptional LysR family regulator
LQQLKYVVTVARTGSMSEASKELFISQPGLTTSIRELETEMGIKIFTRTNKGVVTSNEGERFLGYARQVLEQASLLEGVYKSGTKIKQQFCVSTQHYSFAVNAFVDLIRRFAGEEYDFSLRETETYEIIDDVAKMKSEIGILYLNSFNKDALMKIIKSKSLTFTELFTAKPHVFVSTDHPLADKKSVTMEELADYPYLSFEQGEHNSFYYSEENSENDNLLKADNLEFERVGDAYKIKIKDSRQALEITNKHTEIVDFEIIKGNMDDVFLTVTGKRLGD